MKLQEIKSIKKSGLYVACDLSKESLMKLENFIKLHKIPDISKEIFEKHCTIIYSDIYTDVKLEKYEYLAYGSSYAIFGKEDEKILVLLLNCPDIMKRHRQIMSEYNLNYSHDHYKPHITISYDIGDFDWQKLPIFDDELYLTNEYKEELK